MPTKVLRAMYEMAPPWTLDDLVKSIKNNDAADPVTAARAVAVARRISRRKRLERTL